VAHRDGAGGGEARWKGEGENGRGGGGYRNGAARSSDGVALLALEKKKGEEEMGNVAGEVEMGVGVSGQLAHAA